MSTSGPEPGRASASRAREAMRAQILGQPEVLHALLARHEEIGRCLSAATGRTPKTLRRIWAVGHGDSYFAPLAAAEAFRRWSSVDYTPMLSQEMAAYPPRGVDDEALVIAVSMSGGVGKSIAAAEAARARGARVLAVTNTTGSPLTEVAHDSIVLNIVEAAPFLAGTATYTASLLALLMIAALLSDLQDGARPPKEDLSAAVDAIRPALASEKSLRAWTAGHASAPVWYVLGMGAQEATARYGVAKLVEVADVVGVAHETEEFFHEHHWVARPEHPVVLLSHDDASRLRTHAAVAHLRELRIPVAVVGDVDVSDDVLRVSVPVVESWTSPLVAAGPLQWLAYWLSRARGLDPDTRDHLRGSARYVVSRKYR